MRGWELNHVLLQASSLINFIFPGANVAFSGERELNG